MSLKKLIFVLDRRTVTVWLISMAILVLGFLLSGKDYLNLVTSLIGVTALVYLSKGQPFGQIITIIFSLAYGIVSYRFRYYGELITYVFMSLPSASVATYLWLKYPHKKGESEVKINKMTPKKSLIILVFAPLITLIFYFILKALDTPNLLISTLSITTSFVASMFTFFRSKYYAIAYAVNDVVLIVLWVLATITNITYLPMVICFVVFLLNDLLAFANWSKLELKQSATN